MKHVPLTNSKRTFVVDDEDYDRVNRYNWYLTRKDGKPVSIQTHIGGVIVTIGRFLLQPEKGMWVDHRNRDIFNDLRSNLRPATPQENLRNRIKSLNCSSQFKGVWWDARRNKWYASIRIDGHTMFLGYFISEIDAALAYDEAARKNYGEFALLNFPDEKD